MNEESIEFLKFLSVEVVDVEKKLDAVEQLLGSPNASSFTEAVLSTLVDDVIRLQMMRHDLCESGSNVLASEFKRLFDERIKHSELMRTLRGH